MKNYKAVYLASAVLCCFLFVGMFAAIDVKGDSIDLPEMRKMSKLDVVLVPAAQAEEAKAQDKKDKKNKKNKNFVKRLILIGDVHGCYKPLVKLLRKMDYNSENDKLVLLGDFISKGRQNFDVLDFAVKNKAACVLGNHEVNILQKYSQFYRVESPVFCEKIVTNGSFTECFGREVPKALFAPGRFAFDTEVSIAKRLTLDHLNYLTNCSAMLQLGPVATFQRKNKAPHKAQHMVPHAEQEGFLYSDSSEQGVLAPIVPEQDAEDKAAKSRGGSYNVDGLAVHAGLEWAKNLTQQSVDVVTNIRCYKKPNLTEPCYTSRSARDKDTEVQWSKVWNRKQKSLRKSERLVVYYGHESSLGLNLRKYSRGLDSGCVNGGRLTGVAVRAEQVGGRTVYMDETVSVSCG